MSVTAIIVALLPLSQGASTEIARQLFVSLNTSKTHLRLLNEKMDVANRTACIEKARQMGLL